MSAFILWFFSGKRSDVYKILELSMYAYKSEQKVEYNCRTSLMKQKERSKAPLLRVFGNESVFFFYYKKNTCNTSGWFT